MYLYIYNISVVSHFVSYQLYFWKLMFLYNESLVKLTPLSPVFIIKFLFLFDFTLRVYDFFSNGTYKTIYNLQFTDNINVMLNLTCLTFL